MAHVLTVANAKGGCGKTTLATNLAAVLARKGPTVLLDLDPFGGASGALGKLDPGPTTTEWVRGEARLDTARPTTCDGLRLLPSSPDLANLDDRLRREPRSIRKRLDAEAGAVRWIVLDSPPALGPIATSALVAADLVIVPAPLAALDLERLPGTLGVIREVREAFGRTDLDVLLVPNRARGTRLSGDVLAVLRERYGAAVARTEIPDTVRLTEAPLFGVSILDHDPDGTGADAFRSLAREIERRVTA